MFLFDGEGANCEGGSCSGEEHEEGMESAEGEEAGSCEGGSCGGGE